MTDLRDELDEWGHFTDEADFFEEIAAWVVDGNLDTHGRCAALRDSADRLRAMPERLERLLRDVGTDVMMSEYVESRTQGWLTEIIRAALAKQKERDDGSGTE
ncbi:MAG: hypothetical protein AMS18_00260 [Gemmatimonas sp. SG8_17]|nr:MAG: hypothetical protein AMS18_00260 [Gemmatimonas sp. SG8_17]